MSRFSETARKEVAERAGFRCEYCLMPEKLAFFTFHADHIRPVKQGGSNQKSNAAWCCAECNYAKGEAIGAFLDESDESFSRLFNPRKDIWGDHFRLDVGQILAQSEIGKATVFILNLNEIDRLIYRNQLAQLGCYP